jgi:hypothetical protein
MAVVLAWWGGVCGTKLKAEGEGRHWRRGGAAARRRSLMAAGCGKPRHAAFPCLAALSRTALAPPATPLPDT